MIVAGADKEQLAWFVQAELMHARWAMIGLAGMIAPELLTKASTQRARLTRQATPYFSFFVSKPECSRRNEAARELTGSVRGYWLREQAVA